MATRNFVPRADGEGGIGKPSKHWQSGYINELTVEKVTGPADAEEKFLRGDGTWQDISICDVFTVADGKLCIKYKKEAE